MAVRLPNLHSWEVQNLKFISISKTLCVDWNLYAPVHIPDLLLGLPSPLLSFASQWQRSLAQWEQVGPCVLNSQTGGWVWQKKNRDSFPLWKYLYIHTMNTNKEKNMSFINNSWVRILLSMNVCNCSFSAVKPIHCFKKPSHSFPESEFS